jgi:hypothetical protein
VTERSVLRAVSIFTILKVKLLEWFVGPVVVPAFFGPVNDGAATIQW